MSEEGDAYRPRTFLFTTNRAIRQAIARCRAAAAAPQTGRLGRNAGGFRGSVFCAFGAVRSVAANTCRKTICVDAPLRPAAGDPGRKMLESGIPILPEIS
ncbi:MAG: hypothetical protein KDA41_15935, partial [Planctomycetales bacterium]|nr:hypothetical protein [Planctomycetales bacterium]